MSENYSDGVLIESYRSNSLTERERSSIANRVREPYLWFSPGSTQEDIYKRFYQNPDTQIDLLVDPENNKCIGFSAHYTERFENLLVMFRGGTVIQDRSRGLYKKLLGHSILVSDADFVVAMTQNQRVYETLRSFSPNQKAYPAPDMDLPELVQKVALKFCRAKTICPDTLVVTDVYQAIRKEAGFKNGRDPLITKMFSESLKENDGFFVVVPLK